jgi:hypothetical protein
MKYIVGYVIVFILSLALLGIVGFGRPINILGRNDFFRKTKHHEFRAAVICQDYAGDYYVQADNKVVVAPNN